MSCAGSITPSTIRAATLLLVICIVPSAFAGTTSVDLNAAALPVGSSTPADALLATYGITISNVTSGSSVVLENDPCCSPQIVIEQTNPLLGVVSYTLNFTPPLSELKFSRAAITLGTPVHPAWSASIYAGSTLVTTVGEGFTFIPAPSPSNNFDIPAPGITSMVVTSNNGHFAAFTSALLDNFVITQGQVELVDPVPSLLDGPHVTQDHQLLASGGRLVQGVAADGVTQAVFRIPAVKTGEQFLLTLFNDQNLQSVSSDDDGALGLPGDTTFSSSQILVTAVSTTPGPMAFAVYRAPVDFARLGNTNDVGASTRAVSIQLLDVGTSKTTTTPVQIVRPPVALIHGLWSDLSTWDEFASTLNSSNLFSIYRIDYQLSNFMSVAVNEQKSLSSLMGYLHAFKTAHNVAAVQFDIVGHSMGGLISRYMVRDPRFYMDSNYLEGWIHKLITIDTPHAGSKLASRLDQSSTACQAVWFAAGKEIDGATQDLEPASYLLKTLDSLPLPPTHAIAGYMSPTQDAAASLIVNRVLQKTNNAPALLCGTVFPFSASFSFSGIFGESNDLIVSESSQYYRFSPGVTADLVPGVIHLSLFFPWLVQWAGAPPGALDAASGNPSLVMKLLNTPPSSSAFESH